MARQCLMVRLLTLGVLAAAIASGAAQDAASDTPSPVVSDEAPAPPAHTPRPSAQKFEFQAEVNRMMDILIHSLYSNKDIFLRELISNASDALDKLRFLALTDAAALGEDGAATQEIKISVNPDAGTISLRDTGIGMSREELINNLGTIAKSGTSAFLEKMQQGGDINLIGQFGVGFYSVFLVADYVEVTSQQQGGMQHVWESAAAGDFAVSEDPEGEQLGHGTEIRVHLKDEAREYLQEPKLRSLVSKYSEFVTFPIYLLTTKTVEVPVEAEEGDEEPEDVDGEDNLSDDDDDDDDVEDEEDEEEEEAPATRTETVQEWELLNDSQALWLRAPAEVSDEDYAAFYKVLDPTAAGKALTHAHFKAEGDVEFRSILYVPAKAAFDFYDQYYSKAPDLKLYVRRVFISDDFSDLLPRYLSFLKGLVDSDTLPLNVSREMLQQDSSLKTIRKKLVRKALDMIKRLADAGTVPEPEEEEEEDAADVEAAAAAAAEAAAAYNSFWGEFGKAMKLGIVEDAANRNRLAKLLRVRTSKSDGALTSLEEYVSRMADDQTEIYFLCGGSLDEVARSPFTERLLAKGLEVVYFDDPVDEYMMQNLMDFDGKKFSNASKEDLKLGADDTTLSKAVKTAHKPLTKWWKKLLGDGEVDGVKLSNRLDATPCVVVTSKFGWSANMQRIMQAQALGDASRTAQMKGQRSLEINPRHPLIRELVTRVGDGEDVGPEAEATARLLYETALLESGFPLDDPQQFSSRVYGMLKEYIGMDSALDDLTPESQLVEEEPEEAEDSTPPEFEHDEL